MYKNMKLKEAPLHYIHWIVHFHHSDKSFDWIKEKHPEAIKNAEIFYKSYQQMHTKGDYILLFGRYKGKALKNAPSKYLSWLTRKSTKDSNKWVANLHPDAIEQAKEFLKNNKAMSEKKKSIRNRMVTRSLESNMRHKLRIKRI